MGVYVFGEPGMLLVKVGCSDKAEREKALGRYWRGGRMLYWDRNSTIMTERSAHRILRSRFWLEGEWFVCGVDVAVRAIRRASMLQKRKLKRMLTRSTRRRLRRAKAETVSAR